ncbi:MAG: hypothetical protein MI756_05070 [Chromatiales bacterium]|nr:hypothetical protein [Chromatiales bacterium]
MKNKFFLPFFFLASACGGGSDNDESADRRIDILGSWTSPCMVVGSSESVSTEVTVPLETRDLYGITSVTFEINGQLTSEGTPYTDETCTIQEEETEIISATYELGDMVISDSGLEAQEIDVTLQPPEDTTTIYGIFRIEGSILYLSNLGNETRQTSLDLSTPYTRN